jgi:uncharacterized protein YjbI with pentapeptide repeats
VELDDADLVDANLAGADLAGASLANTDLRRTDLNGARWRDIASIKGANIGGMKDLPEGFRAWALQHGAVETEDDPE